MNKSQSPYMLSFLPCPKGALRVTFLIVDRRAFRHSCACHTSIDYLGSRKCETILARKDRVAFLRVIFATEQ